ncbi:hypothetical protein ACQE98_17545 [Ornithinimicrobium sp. W1679]|uniref:hypothetical protein n=1 Tax=Ornithinimicrobium sp. W1679 TaxID=3418770 RepID=UPI003CF7E7B8
MSTSRTRRPSATPRSTACRRSTASTAATADLAQALDYLEGLVLILSEFDEHTAGRDVRPRLLEALSAIDSHGMNWEPLRYQTADGQGWRYVAQGVENLRDRLLEGYANAAL